MPNSPRGVGFLFSLPAADESKRLGRATDRHQGVLRTSRPMRMTMTTLQGEAAAEQRFRLVVEPAPVAMVMIDRAGRIVMVNAEAERVFGYARAELVGQAV